jgi:hypothetical protein
MHVKLIKFTSSYLLHRGGRGGRSPGGRSFGRGRGAGGGRGGGMKGGAKGLYFTVFNDLTG